MKMKKYVGRQQILPKTLANSATGVVRDGMIESNQHIQCNRCGACFTKQTVQLPNGNYYCPGCIGFGRITSEDCLVAPFVSLKREAVCFAWEGELTYYQQRTAEKLERQFQDRGKTLVWAVTGSGKTEMLFPLIYRALSEGARVALSSPRIDVCRELFPRLQAVFPKEDILLYHGGAEEDYRETAFLICTTHQLLNFYQCFDLLIIDEIDAFPYEGDERLYFASKQAVKSDGCLVYLTATPSRRLLQEIKETHQIEKIPMRFHQRPLIQPQLIWFNHWEKLPSSVFKIKKFLHYIRKLLRDNRVLVFCPTIVWMEELAKSLKKYMPDKEIECVSSIDENRLEKVQQMRNKQYDVLLSTTILERGVTFSNISVIVIGANHPVFSKSALVQIAGRVDRKGAFNHGQVLFMYDQQTQAIRDACKEIREMNRLAKKWLETI